MVTNREWEKIFLVPSMKIKRGESVQKEREKKKSETKSVIWALKWV